MNIRTTLKAGILISAIALPGVGTAMAQTLKIGVIGPLTGGAAPWGLAGVGAAKIAADEVNGAGGLDVGGKKYKIEIVSYDDQNKSAESVAAYNRIINQDGVKLLLLPTSNASMTLRQNVEDDEVIALTGSYADQIINNDTKHIVRVYSSTPDYVPSIVKWMKDNIKERRVALINPNDDSGLSQTRLMSENLTSHGFNIVAKELFERTQVDFQPVLTKVMALNPEIIDIGTTAPATAGLLVRQARDLGYKGLFMKSGGPGPAEVVASAGKQAAEGMMKMLYADPANPGYQALAKRYVSQYGHEPNQILVPYYDGIKVLLAAISKAGTTEDNKKILATFGSVLPMKSTQGDQLTWGGAQKYGVDAQIGTINYLGTIRNGEPVVIGKLN